MKRLRSIFAGMLLLMVAGLALLPGEAGAMDGMGSNAPPCIEDAAPATSDSPCAGEGIEQQDPPPIEVSRLRTSGTGFPVAVVLMAMALLSVASGMALGQAFGMRPPPADR